MANSILDLHDKMKHGWPAMFSEDPRFLVLALCGEVGELANMVKKVWRDDVDLDEEIREEIADIRVYLELVADAYGIAGSKLDDAVENKLRKVAAKKGILI
jgi:NTP pyrophosphatase (non-canonical NTP hydrolase)